MVSLKNVNKYYGSARNPIRAVDDVSLQVGKGEFVVITGPSGSGKTTLLNLIGGMTKPDSGDVIIGGNHLLKMTDAELSRFRAATIGFAFQFQSMFPTLNALDNVSLPGLFSGRRYNESYAMSLLEVVGLAERAGAFAHELSAGQQRRVCIARALVNLPPLLLCDEPTGDLDKETESIIMDMISKANREGATVILTTHNTNLRSYATRCLSIWAGSIDSENKISQG